MLNRAESDFPPYFQKDSGMSSVSVEAHKKGNETEGPSLKSITINPCWRRMDSISRVMVVLLCKRVCMGEKCRDFPPVTVAFYKPDMTIITREAKYFTHLFFSSSE